jgi:hypothetical protein
LGGTSTSTRDNHLSKEFEVSGNVLLALLRLREAEVKQNQQFDGGFCIDTSDKLSHVIKKEGEKISFGV